MNTNESKKQTNQAFSLDCLHVCAHGTLGNRGKPYIPPHRSPFLVHCVVGESKITSVLSCISAPTTREKRNFFSSGNKEQ